MARRLIVLVIVAVLAWGGYWVVGSVALDRALRAWIDDRRGEGWFAEYADLRVQGFPNRFDTTFTELDLADPETGLAWSLPFFQILALSYRPNHVIAVWPDQHRIATPGERLTVTSATMQASLVVEPGTALVLDRATLVTEALGVTSSAGWQSGAAELRLATRQAPVAANAHDIAIEALSVDVAEPLKRQLDPLGALPDEIETLRLETEIAFDAPWDRFAIERARPQPTAIDLDDLTAVWGDLELRAAGAVIVDAAGLATGEFTVKAVNWRQMLDIAVASGALPEASRPSVESALELLAGMSGRPDTIDAPFAIRGGRVFFGPIPLGALPPIRIR
ncbi:MAG: DUF2125 domain-containing protein [Paracoccaceae bacterium]|nr:DUF2125 domain-containing protein [Paracoccaceae bacterium]